MSSRADKTRSAPEREPAESPAPTSALGGTTLAVPVAGRALAWLAARLREVGRRAGHESSLTLLVRREAVTGILWDRTTDLGVVATIEPTELVQAVDDLPPGGVRAEVTLGAFSKIGSAFRSEQRVIVEVSDGAVTVRGSRGRYRVRPSASDRPSAPPLCAAGPTATLDGRDLARALGIAARFADEGTGVGDRVLLSLRDGGVSVLGGGAHRFVRATAAANTPEPIEAALGACAARAADAVLARSTGPASVQVTDKLVMLTGRSELGSLGVVCRRDDAPDVAERVGSLFAKVDARVGALVAQVDAAELRLALQRGRALRGLSSPDAPLITVVTSDARGLLIGHVLATPSDDDDASLALHVEPLDGWSTGSGAVAIDPRLLERVLPKRGPVIIDCGTAREPVRVRVVDGGVSLDTVLMPYAPDATGAWAARVRGELCEAIANARAA